jgi:hypothetical protein
MVIKCLLSKHLLVTSGCSYVCIYAYIVTPEPLTHAHMDPWF